LNQCGKGEIMRMSSVQPPINNIRRLKMKG